MSQGGLNLPHRMWQERRRKQEAVTVRIFVIAILYLGLCGWQEARLLVAKATWSTHMIHSNDKSSFALKGKATPIVDRWFETHGATLLGGEVLLALISELREVLPECRDKLDEMVDIPALTPQVTERMVLFG